MTGEEIIHGRGLTRDQEALVLLHLWLAEDLARKLAWLAAKTVDGDVLGYAYDGLIKAAQRFNPGHGARFSTFAYRPITGAVLDAVERAHPGFTRLHRIALDACEEASGDLDSPSEDPGDGEGALDPVAAAIWIGSATRRWARREDACSAADEVALARVGAEVERLPQGERSLFLLYADGASWQALANHACASISTVKRRITRLRALLMARLRA